MKWFYSFVLNRSFQNESKEILKRLLSVQELLSEELEFQYILLRGNYSFQIEKCDIHRCDDISKNSSRSVISASVPVNRTAPEVRSSWCLHNDTLGNFTIFWIKIGGKIDI